METQYENLGGSEELVQKWEPVLEGIENAYTRKVTATLLENQAKAVMAERAVLNEEALTPAATTAGQLGTFQKFAFPLVRRVYPELLANKIVGVQPMSSPTSQIFYLGHSRAGNLDGTYGEQVVYSKFNLTYRGSAATQIGSMADVVPADADGLMVNGHLAPSAYFSGTQDFGRNDQVTAGGTGLDGDDADSGFDVSNVMTAWAGGPSATYGGQIASFPDSTTTLGWSVSAGEQLRTSGIPELSFHIQQQAVVARTRKMRALWTLEASQDLKAYHNLDLERELTDLLSKEVNLEIDRELIEDLRQIAYGHQLASLGNWDQTSLDNDNPNSFGDTGGKSPNGESSFTPAAYNYEFGADLAADAATASSNVIVVDFTAALFGTNFAPQHLGHRYANLLAVINFASQDIYRTTQRGPGSWLLTSPLMGSMLESAAKLEGGVASSDKPTNMGGGKTIEYKGKFAGKYDLFIDPLYPEDEIMVGYKGEGPMDAGFVYAPYIPLQQLPTVVDPESFQPRKGILTRYAKAAIQPASRFYRIIRVVGPAENSVTSPMAKNTTAFGTTV